MTAANQQQKRSTGSSNGIALGTRTSKPLTTAQTAATKSSRGFIDIVLKVLAGFAA